MLYILSKTQFHLVMQIAIGRVRQGNAVKHGGRYLSGLGFAKLPLNGHNYINGCVWICLC